jgi:hypothetical protein
MRNTKRLGIHWLLALTALTGCALDARTTDEPDTRASGVCTGGKSVAISEAKELMIVDSSVVSSAAASNGGDGGGPLSFHAAMARLAGPGTNVGSFTEAFLRQWEVEHQVGPGKVPAAPANAGLNTLLNEPTFWPRLADGRLDMTRAPFRLLAVVDRMDLASPEKPNGEGRLVYGLVTPGGSGFPMTLIFEYNLPSALEQTKTFWATCVGIASRSGGNLKPETRYVRTPAPVTFAMIDFLIAPAVLQDVWVALRQPKYLRQGLAV